MKTYIGVVVLLYQLSFIGCQDIVICNSTTEKPNKTEVTKSIVVEHSRNKYKQQFHPAWMDYCDPIHCNDYHKAACGVNRKKLHFKWFQSACHIRLNNICASYRGFIKYDWTESKFCSRYVMYWRSGCPDYCESDGQVVCGASRMDNHLALFADKCAMEKVNCDKRRFQQYEEVDIRLCSYYLNKNNGIFVPKLLNNDRNLS